MKIPITQSELWKNLQDDLGETSFFEKNDEFQYLAILKSTPVGNYLYVPYGPLSDNESGFKCAIESLKELAKAKNAIFIRIEPQNPHFATLLDSAIKSKDLNPKDTWVLDLTPEKETIISGFSQGTRTRYNTFSKKGLIVEKTTEPEKIDELVSLQSKLAKRKNIGTFSENYLKTELKQPFSILYLVKYQKPENPVYEDLKEGTTLAASLFFDFEDTRYYMQSAADNDYKKLPATVALLTTALFDAKEKGMKYFDFWGIAPDGSDPSHPWYGFTEFKKSFGGYPVAYAGTYDLPLKPLKYRLYKSLRKFNRKIRKAKTD